MNNQMMKTKKQLISVLVLVMIMLFTFYICSKGYSLSELTAALKNANYTFLLAGLGMMLLFVLCEAANFKIILNVLGYRISMRSCFLYSNIGFYFSCITPSASGGQPAQVYYMKQDKIPISIASIVIFYTVFMYQIAMILLGVAAFILRFHMAIEFAHKLKYLLIIGTIINTGAIFLFFALMYSSKIMPAILKALIILGSKLGFIKNIEEAKSKLGESMESYHEKALLIKKHPVLFLKVLFITLLQLLALSLIPFLVYKSMGLSSNDPINLTACQALLTISVSAIPLPGAEGVTQIGFLHVFNMFFPKNSITYAMLINRALSFYIPLAVSFIIYIFTHLQTLRVKAPVATN